MSKYEQQLKDLAGREAFALAQGREDLLDEIDAERKRVLGLSASATTAEVTHAEQDAMRRSGNHIEEPGA